MVGSLQKGGETNWCAARGVVSKNQFMNLDEIRIDLSIIIVYRPTQLMDFYLL